MTGEKSKHTLEHRFINRTVCKVEIQTHVVCFLLFQIGLCPEESRYRLMILLNPGGLRDRRLIKTIMFGVLHHAGQCCGSQLKMELVHHKEPKLMTTVSWKIWKEKRVSFFLSEWSIRMRHASVTHLRVSQALSINVFGLSRCTFLPPELSLAFGRTFSESVWSLHIRGAKVFGVIDAEIWVCIKVSHCSASALLHVHTEVLSKTLARLQTPTVWSISTFNKPPM